MSGIAFVFPGQGAQYAGMAKDFYETFEDSREIIDKASKITGIDMPLLMFEKNDDLNITKYTQPAILVHCLAVLKQIEKKGIVPDVCAGLSLGEYCALAAAKIMSQEDSIALIAKRGLLMQGAVPAGVGMMAAVLGMEPQAVEEICTKTEGIVSVANYNCPGQIVITGEKQAVMSASKELTNSGAKRVLPLKVSGPFHSKMLTNAGEKLYSELCKVNIMPSEIPYVANATAQYMKVNDEKDGENVRESLKNQISSSVRWQQSVENMIESGIDTFIEIGPGKTLSGMIKKINKEVKIINIDKVEDLEKIDSLAD